MNTIRAKSPLGAAVEALIGDSAVICSRCGAKLENYGDVCSAPLDERCPGFDAIEAAIATGKRRLKEQAQT